jgi:hypothetical protein
MSGVSELEVSAWQQEEVKMWACCYGFIEVGDVISNVSQYNICGLDLLNNMTADELGITDSLAIFMFDERITELRQRDMMEKSRCVMVKKRKTDSAEENVVVKRGSLNQLTGEPPGKKEVNASASIDGGRNEKSEEE